MGYICIMINYIKFVKIVRKKYFSILIILFSFSCGLFESNGFDLPSEKIYVALQALDQVGIVDILSEEIEYIDINYATESEQGGVIDTPHFIVIDEINRYWFVSTITSGFIGRYNLDTDELIDKIEIGDAPALMALDKEQKKLYVSRMMPMGGMMMGTVSKVVQEIDYSNPEMLMKSNEFSVSSPSPHGLAINSDGSEVSVASNTADWFYKIMPETEEVVGVVMDINSPNVEYPNNEVNRLKPIQCLYVTDNLLFITCSAGISYNPLLGTNETIPGQVQLWDTNSMTLVDSINLSWKSQPWHIIKSPSEERVFVALSGDNLYPGTAGVICLDYKNNDLQVVWDNYSEDFQKLHGIAISDDGETIYVSGRGDDNLHIIKEDNGIIIKSIPLGSDAMAAGIQSIHY